MRRVGLVLGAGGVAGQAYHAGVLAALADAGWDARDAEVVVGTSAGSITAALLRAGVEPADLRTGRYRRAQQARSGGAPGGVDAAEQVAAVLGGVTAGSAAAGAAAAGVSAVGRAARPRLGGRIAGLIPSGRVSPGGIVTMVRQVAGDAWPGRDTRICAVRRSDGRRFAFGSPGEPRPPLPLAVASSCAIPGFFQPVVIDGVSYVDGGAHSPTNLDLLAGLRLDLVVVSSPMSGARTAVRAGRLDLPARALSGAALGRELLAVRRRGTPVLVFQPGAEDLAVLGLNAMDGSRWREIVERAQGSAAERLRDDERRRLLLG
jgi:NTE family protein